jgi:hypothetical protein
MMKDFLNQMDPAEREAALAGIAVRLGAGEASPEEVEVAGELDIEAVKPKAKPAEPKTDKAKEPKPAKAAKAAPKPKDKPKVPDAPKPEAPAEDAPAT